MKIFIILLITVLAFNGYSSEKPETLGISFMVSGKTVKNLNLTALKTKLKTHRIKLFDPVYKKQKHYQGFLLQDIMHLAYGNSWKSNEFTEITFIALDGYEAVMDYAKLSEKGSYITFNDLDVKGGPATWEPIGRKQTSPGPFYMVWTGKNQVPEKKYPWPYQLATINLVNFKEKYPEVFPKDVSKESSVYKGFEIFKARCLACHAMNKQGGKVGPDLNAPQNILRYRPVYMVRELIKNPSKYRYTTMPDHRDLSKQQLNQLIDYLKYKKKQQLKPNQ